MQKGWSNHDRFVKHLGRHLEEIALSVLPREVDSDSDQESDADQVPEDADGVNLSLDEDGPLESSTKKHEQICERPGSSRDKTGGSINSGRCDKTDVSISPEGCNETEVLINPEGSDKTEGSINLKGCDETETINPRRSDQTDRYFNVEGSDDKEGSINSEGEVHQPGTRELYCQFPPCCRDNLQSFTDPEDLQAHVELRHVNVSPMPLSAIQRYLPTPLDTLNPLKADQRYVSTSLDDLNPPQAYMPTSLDYLNPPQAYVPTSPDHFNPLQANVPTFQHPLHPTQRYVLIPPEPLPAEPNLLSRSLHSVFGEIPGQDLHGDNYIQEVSYEGEHLGNDDGDPYIRRDVLEVNSFYSAHESLYRPASRTMPQRE